MTWHLQSSTLAIRQSSLPTSSLIRRFSIVVVGRRGVEWNGNRLADYATAAHQRERVAGRGLIPLDPNQCQETHNSRLKENHFTR